MSWNRESSQVMSAIEGIHSHLLQQTSSLLLLPVAVHDRYPAACVLSRELRHFQPRIDAHVLEPSQSRSIPFLSTIPSMNLLKQGGRIQLRSLARDFVSPCCSSPSRCLVFRRLPWWTQRYCIRRSIFDPPQTTIDNPA